MFTNKCPIRIIFTKKPPILPNFRMPEKIVNVELPRLNIQIVQEWSSPPHKKMTTITDENDERKIDLEHNIPILHSVEI